MMVDRRDELGRARTQTINRLHRLQLELIPGGAKQYLSAPQACALIATVKPRDIVGKTRRRFAVEPIAELEAIDKKIKAAEKDLSAVVLERGSMLLELTGIGSTGAARLLADVASTASATDQNRRDDALEQAQATGPGGQRGNDSDSSATGSQPHARLFGQATSRTRHQPA